MQNTINVLIEHIEALTGKAAHPLVYLALLIFRIAQKALT